jgi:hypothetical protein
MKTNTPDPRDRRFVLCIRNDGYPASLEIKKVYPVLVDADGEARGLLRVVDESGDDYLYPADYFVAIEVPAAAVKLFSTGV